MVLLTWSECYLMKFGTYRRLTPSPSPTPPMPHPLVQAQARAVEREDGLKEQLSSFKEEATRQITELTAQLKQKVK